ncbi:hypothetical protein E3N88_34503 [Mikania micrantha]|uniref:Uncharacterized protein n=1 Tax=Mikania micrantha TaxID=192012 RepID=A0A5N6M0Y4_9ASTR|nr:hypothetical protein E3N88_34503 [Mikania micrantha]
MAQGRRIALSVPSSYMILYRDAIGRRRDKDRRQNGNTYERGEDIAIRRMRRGRVVRDAGRLGLRTEEMGGDWGCDRRSWQLASGLAAAEEMREARVSNGGDGAAIEGLGDCFRACRGGGDAEG